MEYGANAGTPHKDTLALVLKSPDDGTWRDEASCKEMGNSEFFMTLSNNGKEVLRRLQEVRNICAGCKVNKECLDFAVRNEIAHGIWGGMTAPERKAMFPKVSVVGQRRSPK